MGYFAFKVARLGGMRQIKGLIWRIYVGDIMEWVDNNKKTRVIALGIRCGGGYRE